MITMAATAGLSCFFVRFAKPNLQRRLGIYRLRSLEGGPRYAPSGCSTPPGRPSMRGAHPHLPTRFCGPVPTAYTRLGALVLRQDKAHPRIDRSRVEST